MIFGCPGSQRFKQPYPEIIKCPRCSGEVEIWTDEIKGVCPGCNDMVLKDRVPGCVDWCRYARECIGVFQTKEEV